MNDTFETVAWLVADGGGARFAVDVLLRVTVLLTAAVLVAIALRRASAAMRHLVWTLALVGSLLVPPLTWAFPAWHWAVLPTPGSPGSFATGVPQAPEASTEPLAASAAQIDEQSGLPSFIRSGSPGSSATGVPQAPEASTEPLAADAAQVDKQPGLPMWSAVLTIAWALGTILWTLWLAIGMFAAWHLARRAAPAADNRWHELLDELRHRCGIRRRVEVRESREVTVPMTWALGRPVILVPSGSAAWSEATKRSVLLHELGHIRRGDCLIHLIGRLARAVYWFHPLVWLAARQLRKTSEQAADDLVLSSSIAPPDYAEHLVALAAGLHGLNPFTQVALPMAIPSDLPSRVLAILDSRRDHRSVKRKTCCVVMLLAALLLIPCAVLRLGYAQDKKPKESAVATAERSTEKSAGPESEDEEATTAEETVGGPKEPPPVLLTAFGKVIDPAGKPVVGATVYLREWSTYRISKEPYNQNPNDVLATTKTDAQGAFRFEKVPAKPLNEKWLRENPWDVVVVAKPYALAWRHVSGPQEKNPLTIRLVPEATISGRITDGQGRPIQNADTRVYAVTALGSDLRPPYNDSETIDLSYSRIAPKVTTDADGRVTIAGLPRHRLVSVKIAHDDFRTTYVRVATMAHLEPIVNRKAKKVFSATFSATMAPPLPRVVGRVIAADTKKPFPETRVDVLSELGTMTDADGRFVFKEILRQPCRLVVSSPKDRGYLGQLVHVDLAKDNRTTHVEVELPRGETVSGRVADQETGEGVAGVVVWFDTGFDLNTATEDGLLPSHEKTDRSGRFEVFVPPARGKLRIRGPVRGYALPLFSYPPRDVPGFFTEIDASHGKPISGANFTIRRGNLLVPPGQETWGVEGSVIDPDGTLVEGADVGLSDWFRPGSRYTPAKTAADGRFALVVTPEQSPYPSQMIIVALDKSRRLRGHVWLPGNTKDGPPKAPLEIRLVPTGIVKGRAVSGGEPVVGASVVCDESEPVKGDPTAALLITNRDFAKTDENGVFDFPFVEADRKARVYLYLEGYTDAQCRAQAVAGQTTELEPFSLMRLDKFVSGMVVDPDGNPVVGADVSAPMLAQLKAMGYPEKQDEKDRQMVAMMKRTLGDAANDAAP